REGPRREGEGAGGDVPHQPAWHGLHGRLRALGDCLPDEAAALSCTPRAEELEGRRREVFLGFVVAGRRCWLCCVGFRCGRSALLVVLCWVSLWQVGVV